MADKKSEERILQLETLLHQKDHELQNYRDEVNRLNEQLERVIAQISGELKMAHLIQQALVPTEIPNIPGFEFSTKFIAGSETGGDYYDIFELDDRFKFGIILSSSSGYG